MLIFKPKWIWYSKATRTYEGGLFKYRYYVYGITVVYSLLSSFLVFINFNTPIDMNPENVTISKTKGLAKITHTSKLGGYKPYVTIIGAPQYPFYYGLLFSWMFRYLTILSIFTVFLAIYLNYMIQSMKIRRRLKNLSNTNNDVEDQLDAIRMDFSSMVVEEFKKSQQKFKKQMNTIFLYPLSYFLLIIAPLVENIEQKLHDKKHGPIIQITIIVAMCHPANCFFDTLIFFCIEKPLKFSWANYQKNLIINNYLIPQDKTGLNTQDKYYLTHKTLLGRLKWYHSKEVSSLIKEGAIVVEDEDKIEIPIRVRLINRFQHWLPFRRTIDLDELHYDINIPKKPCTIIKPEDIENTHRSILTRSIRSFNMDSDSNTDNTPQDDWVVNILKDKNIHSNKSEQFQHILNDVRLADGDIELQSNFTANEEMDDHIDDILEEHAPDDNHDKHVDITDFLNG